jgi:hypothetical protein
MTNQPSTPPSKPISTVPCPADQAAPVVPSRSALADIALAAGIDASDVRAFLTARYRMVRTDIGLVQVSP